MEYKRIYSAFPRLHFHRIGKANQEIRGFLNGKIEILDNKSRELKYISKELLQKLSKLKLQ